MVRFELKIAVTLPLTEEKCKAIFLPTALIKRCWGFRSFWKALAGWQERWTFLPQLTIYDDENWFSEADSSVEIQNNLAHCLWKSIPKPISLSEIARSSWQMTLWGRCNYLNRRGKGTGQWRFWRGNFQKNYRPRNKLFRKYSRERDYFSLQLCYLFFTSTVLSWYKIGLENLLYLGNCKGKTNSKS